MPVTGLSPEVAKAAAVFINSTAGRLQMMRNPGRTIEFPTYSAAEAANLRIPDIKDARIRGILAACWERTKDMVVPQFRDGECEVRRFWDEAVSRGDGLGRRRACAPASAAAPRAACARSGLRAVRRRSGGRACPTVNASQNSPTNGRKKPYFYLTQTAQPNTQPHGNHQMGEPAVPLILERMKSQGGHWFHALPDITGANPVKPTERGNVPAMQEAWLEWGERNGYA